MEIFDVRYLIIDSNSAIFGTRNENLSLGDNKVNALFTFICVGFSNKRKELNIIDIWTMVVKFIEFFTIRPVPYNDFAVLASSSQIPITLADIKVGYNILMTMERGL